MRTRVAPPVRHMVPPIHDTLARLVRLPARVWLLLLAVSAVIAVIVRPAAQWSITVATDRAGGVTATPAGFVPLLGDPVALAGLATAAGLTLAATLSWAVLVLTVADRQRADGPPTVRTVSRQVLSAAPRLLRPGVLVTGLQLAVVQPVAGITVFAPITGELAVPPFIGREFLKAPLSAALWCSLAASVVFVSFRVVLAPAFTIVAGEEPIRGLLSSLRATRSAGLPIAGQLTVLLIGAAIARILVVWASTPLVELMPSEQLRAVVTVLVLSALTVVTAQAVAFSIVATVQSATGSASPLGERIGTPGPTTRRIGAVLMVAVVGCTALLVPSRAVSHPVGVPRSADPLVIAHRGHDRGGPENTITGLEAAAALHPDRVEVDVQQTRDGTFVASHDTNLLVLAGRDEDIDAMTTAAVTTTTVRMHGNADTIPTMTAYVSRARELGVPLLIELKATSATDDRSVAELFTQPHLGPLPDLPVSFYTVEQASVTSAVIRSAHRRGREVYAWTANSDVRMRVMLRAGLDGVVTDRPVAARALVARVAQERPGAPEALRDELSSCCRVP